MDEVRLLRIGDVAERLSVSRTKVYELAASGQIPSLLVGPVARGRQTERRLPTV